MSRRRPLVTWSSQANLTQEHRRILYRWRDPARLTPERIAELEAHDAHIWALEHGAAQSAPGHDRPPRFRRHELATQRKAEYRAHRAAGLPRELACELIGVCLKTGYLYEREEASGG
jgi:hypothetical protein